MASMPYIGIKSTVRIVIYFQITEVDLETALDGQHLCRFETRIHRMIS